MTTTADIVNRALQLIGTRTTVSALELANNSSNEAIQANIAMDNIRTDLLRMAPWNFAVGAANLVLMFAAPGTPENTTPPTTQWQPGQPMPPWLYEYVYPADCLRLLYLIDTLQNSASGSTVPITPVNSGPAAMMGAGPAIPFKVQYDKNAKTAGVVTPQTVVLTNCELPTAYYIQDVTDPNLMDTLFQSAWVQILAATISMALSGDKKLANGLIQAANRGIMDARTADGNEGLLIDDRTPDWIATRGFGGDCSMIGPYASVNWGPIWPTW